MRRMGERGCEAGEALAGEAGGGIWWRRGEDIVGGGEEDGR